MNPWNRYQIEQFEQQSGLQLIRDPHIIESSNKDFGGLHQGQAFAVFKPLNLKQAQAFLKYASQHALPVVIRCHGLSQSGQSLAHAGQVLLDVSALNKELQVNTDTVNAGCSVRWADIIRATLHHGKIPPVFPYNTRISLGGILSVGGLGSASAQQGTCVAHIDSLQVLTIDGTLEYCDKEHHPQLMDAVLAGVGQFGIIYSATLRIRPTPKRLFLRTLYYQNAHEWLEQQFVWRNKAVEYLEANCLFADPLDFSPLERPLFRIALASEQMATYRLGNELPLRDEIVEMPIEEYVFRHESRIATMMSQPNIDYYHPWFECYATREVINENINRLVETYPRSLGPMLHCFPVARRHSRMFQMPKGNDIMTFNILTPGVAPEDFEECRNWIVAVDALLCKAGGKRYISSWISNAQQQQYWESHYGPDWAVWQQLKKRFDPQSLWGSRITDL